MEVLSIEEGDLKFVWPLVWITINMNRPSNFRSVNTCVLQVRERDSVRPQSGGPAAGGRGRWLRLHQRQLLRRV